MNATKENTVSVQFPIWKTIKIGGQSRSALKNALKNNYLRGGSSYYRQYLDLEGEYPEETKEERQINLVRVKIRDLGFTSRPTIGQLFERIEEVGELGSLEIRYHLRWYFPDDLKEGWSSDGSNEWIIGERRNDMCFYSQKSSLWLATHGLSQRGYLPELDDWIIFIVSCEEEKCD